MCILPFSVPNIFSCLNFQPRTRYGERDRYDDRRRGGDDYYSKGYGKGYGDDRKGGGKGGLKGTGKQSGYSVLVDISCC